MKNPLVIGYKGEIGSFILQGLLKFMPKASNIWCYDVGADDNEIRVRLHQSDVIFLCVPMNKTGQFFIRYKNFLRDKVVVEQTSLKSWVPEMKVILKKEYNCTLLSMHVLFRPSATTDHKDKVVGLINKPDSWWIKTDVDKFIMFGLHCDTVNFKTIEEHDTIMATQQALVHRVLLCLDESMPNQMPYTYVSKRVRQLAYRISEGDKDLYAEIQKNPRLKKSLSLFTKNMNKFNILKFMKA